MTERQTAVDVQTAELELAQDPVRAPAVIEQTRPPVARAPSPLDRIAELLERGITPEQLDKFLDVQKKHEAEQARRDFVAAMAAFKAEPIAKIVKNKLVDFPLKDRESHKEIGRVTYRHETLDQVVDAVVGPMAKHGLSHKWTVDQKSMKPMIVVRCVISHENGHVDEPVELFGSPDDSGRKNPLQQVRSTVTFLQRATLLLATGLAAADSGDDDGRQGATGDPTEPDPTPRAPRSQTRAPRARGGDGRATEKQIGLIRKRLESGAIDEKDLLVKFELAGLELLPFERVNDALAWIAERANAG
jgi:hypothetical protein